MFAYSYAVEKFFRAVYTLAVAKGDVRSRLLLVFEDPLYTMDENKLPERLREDWRWCIKQMTKYDELWPNQRSDWEKLYKSIPFVPPPRMKATMNRIKNRTGRQIAEKVFCMWSDLDSMQRDWRTDNKAMDVTSGRVMFTRGAD